MVPCHELVLQIEGWLMDASALPADALAAAEDLAAIVRASPDAMYTTRLDRTILTWNRGAERLYGRPAAEVIGRSFDVMIPGERAAEIEWIIAEVSQGRWVEGLETQRRRADGSLIDLSVTIAPIFDAQGRVDRVASVAGDITALKNSQRELAESLRQLREVVYRDPLTRAGSRTLLIESLESLGGGARDITVLTADVDDFQYFNNTFGHQTGDNVLMFLADLFRGLLADDEILARIGGDEFAIMSHDHGPDRGVGLARAIQAALAEPVVLGGHRHTLGVGMGVATASRPLPSLADFLLRRADLAQFEAKSAGHCLWRAYDADMEAGFAARTTVEERLRAAEGTDQLSLVYQPICDAHTGEILEVEALLRGRHPEAGQVSPAEFIPVAEQCGLILPLGAWALKTACRDIAGLGRCGRPVRLNVNVSPRQLADPGFSAVVAGALIASGLPAERLTLEITEGVIAASNQTIAAELEELRRLGVGLAVDDFGTGHSSLARLHSLPFTTVKVDKSLVDGVAGVRGGDVIVHAVVGMAHGLGLVVVAEGVEHQEQLDRLREIGGDLIQGFLLHRPMPLAELAERLPARAGV